jgi:N,N-dimethylformamidase
MTRRRVDHTALPAVGYFANWSLPAGETADFHLSTVDPESTVSLVRLDRASDAALDWPVSSTEAELGVREIDLGSTLRVVPAADRLAPEAWGLLVEFRLTAMAYERVLVATDDFALRFDRAGVLEVHGGHRDNDAASPILPLQRWLQLALDCRGEACTVTVRNLGDYSLLQQFDFVLSPRAPHEIVIGAGPAGDARTLNAAIGRIALLSRGAECASFRLPAVGRPTTLAPARGDGAVLEIRNAPTFATRSVRWDGSAEDPRQAPEHYDAVMLHDDDLDDAGWPVTHRVAIPDEAESGIYGLTVRAQGRSSTWPFFITPRRRGADLLFLVPSFTYLAYADERLPPEQFPWQCDDAGHRFAVANELTSLYDLHNDGTGVTLASFRRPLATIRDDYLYPLCGAPHLLPVDLKLLRFLAAEGIAVDLITDAELDRDGAARLPGYRGLITGSHPEYWTAAMLDGVGRFQAAGGHLAYLGGNGCYWVTARDGHMIEVRRGLRGIRTWSSAPGETHLATTGSAGGLWRDAGRAEHRLLGVGLAAMGFTQARPYRRTAQSYAADLAWLFADVGDAPIGGEGIVLGGAAGYEVDASSAILGTPAETVVIAVADGFDRSYEIDETSGIGDVRGEMTLTQKADGGLVFAAGSVCWCGALPPSGAMNPVGRITLNLLHRFLR